MILAGFDLTTRNSLGGDNNNKVGFINGTLHLNATLALLLYKKHLKDSGPNSRIILHCVRLTKILFSEIINY
jgi:hypothetical protein